MCPVPRACVCVCVFLYFIACNIIWLFLFENILNLYSIEQSPLFNPNSALNYSMACIEISFRNSCFVYHYSTIHALNMTLKCRHSFRKENVCLINMLGSLQAMAWAIFSTTIHTRHFKSVQSFLL